MSYAYDYGTGDAVGAAAVVLLVCFVVMLLSFAYSILVYVLQSLGLYTVAKRRGIHNPWLSWIPVGNMWILGSISDQYQYVAKGKIRNRRKVLLGLEIALYALMVGFFISYFVMLFKIIGFADTMMDMDSQIISSMLGIFGVYFAVFAVAIVATVFLYMAYYDLFVSCNPDHAVVFLVLSIFMNFLLPYFVFACRKKDLGMPPRKQAPAEEQREPEEAAPELLQPMAADEGFAEEEDFADNT